MAYSGNGGYEEHKLQEISPGNGAVSRALSAYGVHTDPSSSTIFLLIKMMKMAMFLYSHINNPVVNS